jgi:hypothetical protein
MDLSEHIAALRALLEDEEPESPAQARARKQGEKETESARAQRASAPGWHERGIQSHAARKITDWGYRRAVAIMTPKHKRTPEEREELAKGQI